MDLISELKESWGWVGLNPSRIVAENDFGNLIVEDSDGNFWRLCPEDLYCKVVAYSEAELRLLFDCPDFQFDWEMRLLVDAARGKLGELTPGMKYCMTIPGLLGGTYEAENFASVPIEELVRFSGDIAFQCKDLPDGTQVELKVID